MTFTIIDAPQRSPDWFAARLGRVTGTRAGDLMAAKTTAAYANMRAYVLAEILSGTTPEDGFVNDAMKRGIEMEPLARMAYEMQTGNIVRETGFLKHNELRAGCSLDGDIDNFNGIWECKCPNIATHLGYIEADKLPAKYKWQVTHNLWQSGAAWCDFTSYDDRLPPNLQIFIKRVLAKDLPLAEYETELLAFLKMIDERCGYLRNLRAPEQLKQAA